MRFDFPWLLRPMMVIIVAAACCGPGATPAADPKEAQPSRVDFNWLRREGTAALMDRPASLPGVKSWILESRRHRGAIKVLAVAPDGKRAATGGEDGIVRIWNLETGALDKALYGHRYGIYLAAWSPEGSLLATHSGADSTTRIWDVESGQERKKITDWNWIHGLVWSRDGLKLAASSGGSGKVYVSQGLAPPAVVTELGQQVGAMQWSPDGSRLAVSVAGSAVSLIDASSGKLVRALDNSGEDPVMRLEWSVSGNQLGVATRKGVTLWQADGSQLNARLDTPATAIAWSPDDKRLLLNSGAGMLIRAAEAEGPRQQLRKLAGNAVNVAWSPRTDQIIVLAADRLEILQPDGTSVRSIDVGGLVAPVFRPGKPILTGLNTRVLSLWDARTFESLGRLEGLEAPVSAAAWSVDGLLATGDAAGGIRIWTVGAEPAFLACQGHKTRITHLSWSSNGEQLASLAADDKEAKLWTSKAEPAGVLEGHEGPVLAVAWAPGGRAIATGGKDERVLVWETEPVSRKNEVMLHEPVLALAWSAVRGAPTVAALLGDVTIPIFNPTTGKQMLVLGEDVRYEGGTTSATAAWLPGGRPLLLTTRDQLAQVWDLSGPRPIGRWMAPGGSTGAGVAGGGAVAFVRNDDATVRLQALKGGQWAGTLLDDGGIPVAIDPAGGILHPSGTQPDLVAIVDTGSGQRTLSLEELAARHSWKPGGKDIKLPVKE